MLNYKISLIIIIILALTILFATFKTILVSEQLKKERKSIFTEKELIK